MALINLDELQEDPKDRDLYFVASRKSGQKSGTVEIDIPALEGIGPDLKYRLALAAFNQSLPDIAAPKPAEPVVATVTSLPAEDDFDIEAEQKADLQRAADQARATQRLKEYQAGGLEDTQANANANAIRDFVDNSAAHGYWSAQIVDVAIANLGPRGTNQLTWKSKAAQAPPTPEQAREVLGKLPDGTKQLPLQSSEFDLRRASRDQRKDWLKRTREATGQTIIGPGKRTYRVASQF